MRNAVALALAAAAITLSGGAALREVHAQGADPGSTLETAADPTLELTAAQRKAIYDAVSQDRSKTAATQFPPQVGADVPPMIELYVLPDQAVTDNPAAKLYKYTMVHDQVVLVDPTRMRVVDVIGPKPNP